VEQRVDGGWRNEDAPCVTISLEWSKFTFRNSNLAVRMVSGVRRSEHITPVLEDPPVSQRVGLQDGLMLWKYVHGVAPAYLSDLYVPATAISGRQHLRSAASE